MHSYMTIKKKHEVAPSPSFVVSENSAFTPYVKEVTTPEVTTTQDKMTSRREAFSYIRNLFGR